MKRRPDIREAPIHNLGQLAPISNFLELEQLDGRTGDDEAVVFFIANIVESAVKLREIILRSMRRNVGFCVNEIDFDLQRRISEQTKQLRFGDVFDRHEIQN